jgi:4-hydroxythreonine-4-phosphate dehydrogenase
MESSGQSRKPLRIGITHGDANGIGYEIILKTLADSRLFELVTPVVYGSSKVASYYKKVLDTADINFNIIKSADQVQDGKANLVNLFQHEIKIDIGQSTSIAGEAAFQALEAATNDMKRGLLDALVTAPINKQNIQSDQFNFLGHTEYLANKFEASNVLMLMVSSSIRIGVITGHVAISDVPGLITREKILQKVRIMNQSLIQDFGIRRPRIAILGLNPHAGDRGLLGKEEEEVIIPAIQQAFEEGILTFGPYASDGFFGASAYRDFDGVLAMYHDQGLVPFKTLSFKSGVNFTAGLPVVRTSPAHGTGYDIAGKNSASLESFREALYLAIDVVQNRKFYKEITENPLKFSALEADNDNDRNELKNLTEDN